MNEKNKISLSIGGSLIASSLIISVSIIVLSMSIMKAGENARSYHSSPSNLTVTLKNTKYPPTIPTFRLLLNGESKNDHIGSKEIKNSPIKIQSVE